jgi:hypothetical protein
MENSKIIITILACCLMYSIYQTQHQQDVLVKKSSKKIRSVTAVQNIKGAQTINNEFAQTDISEKLLKNSEEKLDPSYLEFARSRDLATRDLINEEYNAFVTSEFNTYTTNTITEDQLNENEAQALYSYETLQAQDEEASEELDWDVYISLNDTYERD